MLKLTGIKSKFIYGAMVKSLSFLAHCLTYKKVEQGVQNDFRVILALSPFFPFRLSCTSTDQAQICNDACLEEFGKCIEVECENDITDAGCIRDCGDVAEECDLKCPCQIGGECELGCPCPSFQCEPVCDETEDNERSKVNYRTIK